ncbi:MAG: hypothetical protein LBC86_10285 [Oscillospiraceae bacterium]|jgi:hypothetical protein|nr:hypothetical protein [Oscillospiraceae bacterium]
MNRIEIVGLFSALEVLCEDKNIKGIETIVKRVLNEAVTVKDEDRKESSAELEQDEQDK